MKVSTVSHAALYAMYVFVNVEHKRSTRHQAAWLRGPLGTDVSGAALVARRSHAQAASQSFAQVAWSHRLVIGSLCLCMCASVACPPQAAGLLSQYDVIVDAMFETACVSVHCACPPQAAGLLSQYDVIVDAMFGFSFKGTPRPPFDDILQVKL